MTSYRNKILGGTMWSGLERTLSYGVNFIVMVVLARLLGPKNYGEMALSSVAVNLFSVFIDCGMGEALIQKQDMDDLDCNSLFYCNLLTSFLLYLLIFISAPWIASFYEMPKMVQYLRVLGLSLILSGGYNIQLNLMVKKMLFKYSCIISTSAIFVSAVVGLVMAFSGMGTWALVCQLLTRQLCYCLLYFIFVHWRPSFMFSFNRLKILFRFAWKLLCSGILNAVYNNIYGIIFGKLYDVSALSFYEKGKHIPEITSSTISNSLIGTLFPVFAELQNDTTRISDILKRAMKNVMFVILPGLFLLICIAPPLFEMLYGKAWLPAVPFVRIFCISFIFTPLLGGNRQVILAMGRTDLLLFQEVINKVVILVVIVCTCHFGALGLTWGWVIINCINYVIKAYPCKKLINYSFIQQFWDLRGLLFWSSIALTISFFTIRTIYSPLWKTLCGFLTFSVVYLCGTLLFRVAPQDIFHLLRQKFYIKK